MSFAAFILKLEADTKGVNAGVNTAIGHFKRLGATVKEIEKRKEEMAKKTREEAKAAFERLKPEQQLNQLLRTREQLAHRLKNVENHQLKNSYLQKQLELEKQIAAVKERQGGAFPTFSALGGRLGGLSSLSRIPGVGRLVGGGLIGATVAGVGGAATGGVTSAEDIKDLSLKNGMSTDFIQRIMAGAAGTNTDFSSVMQVILDIQKNRSKALLGDKEATKSFGRLGFDKDRLSSMSSSDTALALFDMVSSGAINENNMAAFFSVAEEGAKNILPGLNKGLSDMARNFNGITSSDKIDALSAIGQSFREMWAGAKAAGSGFLRNAAGFVLGVNDDSGVDTSAMRERLALKQAERQRAAEQAEGEDFNAELEWLMGGDVVKKTAKRRSNRGGVGNIDTDSLARIGLFRGQSESKKFQEDLMKEVRSIQRDIAEIREEAQS